MRVGLVIYGNLELVSGGYLYDRKLVNYLQRQGDEVHIIALPWRNYLRHLGDNFASPLLQRLEQGAFDILLQDELNHPSLFYLNRRLRLRIKYPLIAIIHHLRSSELRPAWQNRFYGWIEKQYLVTLDGFVFNSHTTQQTVHQMGEGLPLKPSIVAQPGGDQFQASISEAEIIHRCALPGPLRLLFLGNLIPRKGLHTLLEAMQQLSPETCRLTVIGNLETDRSYTGFLRGLIRQGGLEGRVQLCGYLEAADVAQALKNHHVLVAPSSYEGFGIVYLEGMAFGLPAIGSTAGAAGEIITPEVDGFLIPPGDASTLAECIRRLAQDRKALLAMSLAARRRYLAQPTWEQTTERIRAFLSNWQGLTPRGVT
jgi:glycosyltransferase involved in cell wall biosynthesis